MDETRWQDVERERLSLADLLDSLTSAQWETQSLCERWRVRDVAAHVAMSPVPEPSMSTLVAALVRARLIRITSKGREVIAVAAPVQAAIEAEWAAHLGARRMQQLTAALLALRAITDPYADDVSQGGVSRRTRD